MPPRCNLALGVEGTTDLLMEEISAEFGIDQRRTRLVTKTDRM
jgi:hypothetical protein